jgi:hypothetical protein
MPPYPFFGLTSVKPGIKYTRAMKAYQSVRVVDVLTCRTGPKNLLAGDGALPVTYEAHVGQTRISQTTKQRSNSTSDSEPSQARKRGSGGGSPRKYDDLLATGPSDLDVDPDLLGLLWMPLFRW